MIVGVYLCHTLRKHAAPVEDMLAIFQIYISPILEYACAVWHPAITKYQSQQIERVENALLK